MMPLLLYGQIVFFIPPTYRFLAAWTALSELTLMLSSRCFATTCGSSALPRPTICMYHIQYSSVAHVDQHWRYGARWSVVLDGNIPVGQKSFTRWICLGNAFWTAQHVALCVVPEHLHPSMFKKRKWIGRNIMGATDADNWRREGSSSSAGHCWSRPYVHASIENNTFIRLNIFAHIRCVNSYIYVWLIPR